MEKIVLDTNIYVSAIVIGKTCEEIIHRARLGEYAVYTSPPILEESSNVLSQKFKWSGLQIATVLEDLRAYTTLIIPKKRINAIKMDPPDNRILECAMAAKASCIVTGDTRHLLPLRSYQKIRIVSPSEFLRR